MATSAIGTYKSGLPLGTSLALVTPVDDVPRNALSASDPGSWGMVAAYDAGIAGKTSFTHTVTLPSRTGAIACQVLSLGSAKNTVEISFCMAKYNGAAYSTPNNATCDASLFLMKEVMGQNNQVEYKFEYLGKLNLTCGNTAVNANSAILNPSSRFVDTIVVAEDVSLSPGLRVTGQPAVPADTISVLQLDTKGSLALVCLFDNASISGNIFVSALKAEV